MLQVKALNDFVIVPITYIEEESIIQLSDKERRISRIAAIISAGPDVANLKVGDEILIPGRDEGRVVFPLDGREYASFPESSVRAKKAIM